MPTLARERELLAEGELAERLGELDRAISCFSEAARSDHVDIVVEALTRLADARRSRSDWDQAIRTARLAQRLASGPEHILLLAHAVIAEGNAFMCRGDFVEAKMLFERVATLTEDCRMRGLALQNIGSMLAQQGQLGAAERAFSESYGYFLRAGYRRGEATALNNHGRAALDRDDATLAETILEQAVVVAQEIDHGELIALATLNLAEAKGRKGDLEKGHELASIALGFFNASGNRWREIESLRLIGSIDERSGHGDAAAASFARGLRLALEIGATVEIRTLTECVERLQRSRTTAVSDSEPADR